MRQPAPEHDGLWVERVDQGRESDAQICAGFVDDRGGLGLALFCCKIHRLGGQRRLILDQLCCTWKATGGYRFLRSRGDGRARGIGLEASWMAGAADTTIAWHDAHVPDLAS